jgi:hypothetical protein
MFPQSARRIRGTRGQSIGIIRKGEAEVPGFHKTLQFAMNLSGSIGQIMRQIIQPHLLGAGTLRIDSNVFSDYRCKGLDRSVRGYPLVGNLPRPKSALASK